MVNTSACHADEAGSTPVGSAYLKDNFISFSCPVINSLDLDKGGERQENELKRNS